MLRTVLLEPLLNLLLFFYALIPGADFGLAVIALTIFIRILLWPLVRKQLHHQKAMRDLQPEIAKAKKKAKGDKQKESQLMLELFKEKEVNPFGSIGIAILQFPILIALFFVLREVVTGDIAASTYGFVQSMPLIQAIIENPDAFDPMLFGYFHMKESSLILALLAGGAQFIQGRQLTPQNSGDDASAKMGATMVKVFPFITVVVAMNFPSALALYWFVSSSIAAIQQYFILSSDVAFMQKLGEKMTNGKKGGQQPKKKEDNSQPATQKQSTNTKKPAKQTKSKGKRDTKKPTNQKTQSKPKPKTQAKPKGG